MKRTTAGAEFAAPAAATSTRALITAAGTLINPRPKWVEDTVGVPGLDFVAREWDRQSKNPDAWFDHVLADRLVALWPRYFRNTEGRWYNKPFALANWQEPIVRLLVGWRNAEGFRVYRRLLLWVGKKNGKTEFLAALSILFWIFDREPGGQGYAFARNEKQAGIVFEKMKTMIGMSPQLAPLVRVYKKSLYCPEYRSRFILLPGTAKGLHGISASCVVGDEMHEWQDDDTVTTLHQSTAARSQPIELYGSTAGIKGKGYGWDLFEETQSLIEGRLNDFSTLAVIFALPPDADWSDEKLWPQANPNIGISPTWEYLRAEAEKAKDNPRREANFRRYHLNQWVSSQSRWIPVARWDLCADGRDAWKELPKVLQGRTCFGMLDLSKNRDITARCLLFPPVEKNEKWRATFRFWVPEATIEERAKRDRVKYDVWSRLKAVDGTFAIETTPGDWVDQDYIKGAIQEDSERFDVKAVGYDPWGATKLAQELMQEGAPMIVVRQGVQSMGEASVEFEKMVYAGKFDHGNHPVMRWMVENVVLYIDRNGNFKPDKAASPEKIDGVIAAIGATALAMQGDALTGFDSYLKNPVMVGL